MRLHLYGFALLSGLSSGQFALCGQLQEADLQEQ